MFDSSLSQSVWSSLSRRPLCVHMPRDVTRILQLSFAVPMAASGDIAPEYTCLGNTRPTSTAAMTMPSCARTFRSMRAMSLASPVPLLPSLKRNSSLASPITCGTLGSACHVSTRCISAESGACKQVHQC